MDKSRGNPVNNHTGKVVRLNPWQKNALKKPAIAKITTKRNRIEKSSPWEITMREITR